MTSLIIACVAIAAIFAGLYYIGTEYSAGTGFITIGIGVAVLLGLASGKFDKYFEETKPQEDLPAEHETIYVQDTLIQLVTEEVHDTVYVYDTVETIDLLPVEDPEPDSIVVDIVSEIELDDATVDSIADAIVYNH